MIIDPHRLVVLLHILLFVYWLGPDLGVMINGIYANKADLTGNARAKLREAGGLIDMAPRTCFVLMVPVGLTLASSWGLAVSDTELLGVWIFGLVWLWIVWMIRWRQGKPNGMLFWKIDLGIRIVATVAFLGAGISSLVQGFPVESAWLAMKMLLFGVLVLLGVIVRFLLLLNPPKPAPLSADGEYQPQPFWTGLRIVVFTIWGLVFMMAFLGVTKPVW